MHKALLLLKSIPQGRVVTYKELARVCNTSPRGIGRVMAKNKDPIRFPCYKVVASNGALCGYSAKGGLEQKKKLLQKENIMVSSQGRVNPSYFYTFNSHT